MNINLILILFIILCGLWYSNKDNQHSRGVFIILCSIVLVLVAALRSPEWFSEHNGIDSMAYKNIFEFYSKASWQEIRYIISNGTSEDFDAGFIVLVKIFGWFTNSFYVYSLMADLLFFIPLGITLYRYCTRIRQIVFAYILYVALIQIFLLAGARQVFAIGFDMMALLAVVDRKKWSALVFFLMGLSIHFSSFLFVIPLLMVWFDVKPQTLKWTHILSFMLFPVVLAAPNLVILFLGEASGVEKYANYGMGEVQGGATTFILLIEILSLFCLFAIKKPDLQNNQSIRIFYVMAPFLTLLAPLMRGNGTMVRISSYYHLYLTLLVPFAIDCMFKEENRRIVYAIAIVALAFMTLKGGGMRYYFFWQV